MTAIQNPFRDHFLAKVKAVLDQADAIGRVGHAGVRGRIRELLAAGLLRPVLPPEVAIGSGLLATAQGPLSPQIDLILYDPRILPPALFNEAEGYFPVESCLYAIEIKTQATAQTLKDAIENARKILSLPRVHTEHWTAFPIDGAWLGSKQYGTPQAICGLLAFGSDLTSDPSEELARYRRLDDYGDSQPALSVLCIRGRGYWYFTVDRKWKFRRAEAGQVSEIVAFLSGVSNTLPQLMVAKGRPRFGSYLSGSEVYETID